MISGDKEDVGSDQNIGEKSVELESPSSANIKSDVSEDYHDDIVFSEDHSIQDGETSCKDHQLISLEESDNNCDRNDNNSNINFNTSSGKREDRENYSDSDIPLAESLTETSAGVDQVKDASPESQAETPLNLQDEIQQLLGMMRKFTGNT